jgi:hypothetical protein
MEDFLKAINDYNEAISEKDADSALKECIKSFADLVREYAPRQSNPKRYR